jgi:membrane-associated progesterone receptor component
MSSTQQLALYALLLALPLVVLASRAFTSKSTSAAASTRAVGQGAATANEEPKTIMQPPRDDLQPAKDTPFTLAELAKYDGSDEAQPIYLAIKGASRLSYDCCGKADEWSNV